MQLSLDFLDRIHMQFPQRQKMSHCHHPDRSNLQCRRYRNLRFDL